MKTPTPKKLPSGSYRLQIRINGEYRSITAATAKECKLRAEEMRARQVLGQTISARTSLTLGQAIDRFIEDRSAVLSPSTIRNYIGIRNNRFQSVINRRLNRIDNWQGLINDEAKTCSAKTLKNGWALISTVLAENKIEVPDVKLPQIIKKERTWLDSNQITLLLEAIKDTDRDFEAAVILGLHSLRLSEILALSVSDIYDDKVHVAGAVVKGPDGLVKKETNKNTTSRRNIPVLIPRLYDVLPTEGPIVSLAEQTLNKYLKRVCAENDLPIVTMHCLRHSFVALGVEKNIPIDVIQRLGGWSDYDTIKRVYTHISESVMNRYAEELKDFFG